MNTNNRVYKYNGNFFEEIGNIGQSGLDIRATTDYLVVTSANHVFVFNPSFTQSAHIQSTQITAPVVTFSCATVINETIYIGTNENGILASTISNSTNFEFIMPDGPVRNYLFSIDSSSTNLWATYGGYNVLYNPYTFIGTDLTSFGISKFNESGWLNIPYTEVLGAKSLTKITVNPNNENQVFVGSYHNGLIEVLDNIPTTLFNVSNSSLQSLDNATTTGIRVNGSAFDRAGNLWVTNSNVKNQLNVLKTNRQWQAYNMEDILANYTFSHFNKIVVDNSGTKWMASYLDGVIAFNENTNVFKKITFTFGGTTP